MKGKRQTACAQEILRGDDAAQAKSVVGEDAAKTKKRPTSGQEDENDDADCGLAGARSFSSLVLLNINFIFLLYDTCSLSSLPIVFVFGIIVFHL